MAKRQRRRLLIVSSQVRSLPLVQRAHAVAKRNGRSPPKAAFAGSNPADGTPFASGPVRIWEARRLSTAQGEFDSRPDRNDVTCQGIPTSRGRRLRPGVLQVQILSLVPDDDGRVAQWQRSRLMSGRREVRFLPRPLTPGSSGEGTLALNQRCDGSSPSPGSHARRTTRA